MSKGAPAADWRSAEAYAELLLCERRFFAWEWLRRNPAYRRDWNRRDRLPGDASARMGLVAWIDPAIPAPRARPIWSVTTDPGVLDGRPAAGGNSGTTGDMLDILTVAPLVSVEVTARAEHWLLSDGHWAIRLDLHDGTLLGGPLLIEHRLTGLQSLTPKLAALRQLAMIAEKGQLPAALMPRERRAAQWILELRVADALLAGASQQDMARHLFPLAVASPRWRVDATSYRLRVQRLVRKARRHLEDPFAGPWFE
ncbi:MAG TPA: DUF6499 domain-containing protein [Sphingopyxis sp.]|nr:DUF6499 domain-containing protein [Sphingopyxis sp.]HWV59604.1 DUF6499 domain-containing protein [Sphingopyxis sp.]